MNQTLCYLLLLAASLPADSVRDHGAVGDGKADDSQAIQKAADSGGVLSLPRGAYRITRSIRLDLARNGPGGIHGDGTATVIMAGPGPAFEIVGSHKGTAGPETVTPLTAERERAPLIDGFAVTGAHPEADGIRATGTIHGVFSRLYLSKLRNGLILTGRNRNVTLSDVNVYDNSGIGILLDKLNLHQIDISNSHISYNRQGGIVVRESEIRNIQIGNCDIEGNMTVGGPPTANVLFDTRSGSIREGALTGSTLQHFGKAVGSANIRFIGQPDAPRKVGFFSITGNHISDAGLNIHLRHARGVNVTGNTMGLGFEYNLLVEGSSNITVGPNTLDQNPDYDQPGFRNTIVFEDSSDSNIHGLLMNRARGAQASLTVRRSHHFHITDVTILDSDGIGILLDQVEWTRVAGLLFHDRRPGATNPVAIRLTSGRKNRVSVGLVEGKVELAPGSVEPE
jgi:hypothetical protein